MRHHIINGKKVDFTPQEELDQDVKDAAYTPPTPPTDEDEYNNSTKDKKYSKALEAVCADKFGMTPAQMKSAIKAKM